MSNPTSSFGWQMPTSSDLVTDLPADFEVFGQAVDTTLADLKGGTTGQILSKASNTDMDFTWIANDQGDITGVTAGTGLTGGGTSGAVTLSLDNAAVIAPTIVDAKGDLISATAADTPARLAVGANDTVLTADSTTATGLKWAAPVSGGMTLLESGTFSGASVTTGTLSGAYNELVVYIYDQLPATGNTATILRLNGDANTRYKTLAAAQNAPAAIAASTFIQICSDTSAADGQIYLRIPQYAVAGFWKAVHFTYLAANSATNVVAEIGVGAYNQTGAITTLTFLPQSGNWTSGTYKVYGVK